VARPRIRGRVLRRPCRELVPVVDGCATIHLFWAGNEALLPWGDGRLGPSWGTVAPLGATSGAAAVSRRSPDSIWPKSILGRLAGSSRPAAPDGHESILVQVDSGRFWPKVGGLLLPTGPNRFWCKSNLVDFGRK